MRFFLLLCVMAAVGRGEVPQKLADALLHFRADGAPGWSFVQTSVAAGESRVERYDAAEPEFNRWSLVAQDGRPATADEQRDYHEKQTRRSRGGTAPRITESLDLSTLETVSETPERAVYRCRLKPGERGDKTAEFLRVTLVLHPPTQVIERFEIASVSPFSPALAVQIAEMKTVMTFSRPTAEQPSLLLGVTTRLRGRAFWIKSLDQDLTVTCSGHMKAFSTR